MKPEVWRRVEELCQQALELDESRRAEFLQSAYGGDDEFRREVESLLAHEKKAEQFIEFPAHGGSRQNRCHRSPQRELEEPYR